MNKVNNAIQTIKEFTVAELIEFFGALKEAFGITEDMLSVGSGSASAASDEDASAAAAIDPNKKVSIVVTNVGTESKLAFIKATKELLSMSLADAGAKFTELSGGNNAILQSDLTRKNAEELIGKLKALLATATIEIK
jgi:ribosomal protein L7/L12